MEKLNEDAVSGSNLPRVGGVAEDNGNEDEKIYYGFGVFMGLPLADLKAMKNDFVEQQALTGDHLRHSLPSSGVVAGRTHRVEDNGNRFEHQENVCMESLSSHHQQRHLQQHQVPSRDNNYQRLQGEGHPLEYADNRLQISHDPP